ncbi:ABC transporter ATP-binding protein [Spiroplasma chinense]|uniref:ABC transporter ATP-binding protein n=1 Tax=Spiroplasma chinense TaxID=216932 RepID=A0A5B9Y6R1_9MOLU|nr:ABC transporter ATP-binding protein [Spiroplasma chinense]QEH61772.1 ABC transporter ATP-binding protein [Spiroplasma chinense]
MIKIENITKDFGNDAGNFGISLSIKEGEIYGIMGANGSGKSTLLRQILGFLKPDSGEIYVNNKDPFNNSQILMSYIGYIPGELSLFNTITGISYLKICANLKGNVDWSFVEKLINFFKLDVNKKIKKMSSGMKQKLAIISALMHKPKILVLDEPTRGLDISATEQFKEIILIFKNEFKSTIIFCSHVFDEINDTCDKVIFINQGRFVKEFLIDENSNFKVIKEEFLLMNKIQEAKELF